MWVKPNEILASFSENPGPDIVFYDLGKVVDSVVVDERPDGKFDRNRKLKFQMENRMTDERKWISDNRRHFLYLQIH